MGLSIMQDWASDLGLRHQGVLVAAVRGCDVSEKDDSSKLLARFYRGYVLRPHCGDIKKAASFMKQPETYEEFWDIANDVVRSHDHLPHHYIMHFIHAASIVGYKHPDPGVKALWVCFYYKMCNKFHMIPETEEALDQRLNADEQSFAVAQ